MHLSNVTTNVTSPVYIPSPQGGGGKTPLDSEKNMVRKLKKQARQNRQHTIGRLYNQKPSRQSKVKTAAT
jgi:hypothetical protein